MNRFIVGAMLAGVGIIWGPAGVKAQDKTWTNPAGGDFSNAANWDAGVPVAADAAIFNLPDTYNVNLTADHSVNSYRQSGGNVTLSGGQILNSLAVASSGSYVGNGSLTLTGAGTQYVDSGLFYLGKSGGSGVLNVLDQASIQTDTAIIGWGTQGGVSGAATVNGSGTQWTNGGSFAVGFRTLGSLQIENGGAVNTNSTFEIGQGNSAGNGSVIVTDTGSSLTTAGTLTVSAFGTGNLTVQSGGSVTSGSAIIGNSANSNGSVLITGAGSNWSSGNLTVGQAGTGSLVVDDGGQVAASNFTIGNSSGSSGTVTITNGGALDSSGQSFIRYNGTAEVTGAGSTWNAGNLQVGQTGAGSLTIDSGGQVTASSFNVGTATGSSGTVVITNGGVLNSLSGTNDVGGAAAGAGTGSVTISGAGSVWNANSLSLNRGNILLSNGGTLNAHSVNINSGGMLEINNGSLIAVTEGTNFGQILVSGNADFVDSYNGQVGSTLEVRNGAIATFHLGSSSNGEIITEAGSTLRFLNNYERGLGNFSGGGDLVFDGILRNGFQVAGAFDIANNVELASNSELELDIGGLGASQFDRLDIHDDLLLSGGDLNITLLNGFEFSDGQEFVFANVDGSLAGTFGGLSEGGLVGNYGDIGLYITYMGGDGNDIGLFTSSVPEPGAAALLGLVSIALIFRRRRGKVVFHSVK